MEEKTLTVCVVDKNGQYSFQTCYCDSYMTNEIFDIAKYEKDNPDVRVLRVFSNNDNLIALQNNERDKFADLCSEYDFEPSDYRKLVVKPDGQRFIFVGFLPQNHKYKAGLLRIDDGRSIKATLSFVRRFMTDRTM